MEKIILVGGEAGQGIAKTGYFIGKIFSNLGFYVFNYRDYPSLIRGGHNFNVLRISNKPIYSHKNKYDIVIALDQKTIDIHQKDLNKNGFILSAKNLRARKIKKIDIETILNKLKAPKIMGNNVLIGCLFKYLGLNLDILLKETEKEFKKRQN